MTPRQLYLLMRWTREPTDENRVKLYEAFDCVEGANWEPVKINADMHQPYYRGCKCNMCQPDYHVQLKDFK